MKTGARPTGTVRGMSTHLSSWLAGEDLTTPANHRSPVAEAPPPSASPSPAPGRIYAETAPGEVPYRPARSSRTDALGFLAAVWVVVAAVPVAYLPTGRFDMLWNDAMVGVAAAAVTMTRLVRTGMAPSTTGISCALGGWLAVAPFALGYGTYPTEQVARWNDVVSGAAILVLGTASMVRARARRAAAGTVPTSPGLVVGPVEPAD